MINSILILGSTYSKNKIINTIFVVSWTIFMLLGSNLKTELGIKFTIVNFIAFVLIFKLGKIINKKYNKEVFAIISIIIWSIIIDIICYFLYPQFTFNQNIISYISNGILFNCKYLVSNIAIIGTINLIPLLSKNKKLNPFIVKGQ